METEFKNHEEYVRYVSDMWNEGYIKELEENELIIVENVGDYSKVNYRCMTKEEYEERYKSLGI